MLKYPHTHTIQFMGIPTIDRKQLIDWKEEALWK